MFAVTAAVLEIPTKSKWVAFVPPSKVCVTLTVFPFATFLSAKLPLTVAVSPFVALSVLSTVARSAAVPFMELLSVPTLNAPAVSTTLFVPSYTLLPAVTATFMGMGWICAYDFIVV